MKVNTKKILQVLSLLAFGMYIFYNSSDFSRNSVPFKLIQIFVFSGVLYLIERRILKNRYSLFIIGLVSFFGVIFYILNNNNWGLVTFIAGIIILAGIKYGHFLNQYLPFKNIEKKTIH